MSLALLAPQGVGAFICGRDRFRREVLSREDAAGVFATVECEDLFEDVALPCLIAFFVGPEDRDDDGGLLVEAEASKEELAERALSHEIKRALRDTGHYYIGALSCPQVGPMEPWRLVARELERRRREEASQRPTYSVELRARDRLAIRPGPFVRQALAKAGRLKLVETLHNQPVGHFALNALDWRLLGELEQECDLTHRAGRARGRRAGRLGRRAGGHPALRGPPADAARLPHRPRLDPLHSLRPRARLSGGHALPAAHRLPHQRHQAARRSRATSKASRSCASTRRRRRSSSSRSPTRSSAESTEDIQYLLEHFEIPNPGDIATRFPEEVERQRQLLDEIAADGRANGKDPAFEWKRFQREDLARALTKTRDGGGFILSWEQGGGKTLGAAGYAQGAVRNGARNQVLFIVPQDLIPQYRQDISDKLGIEVEHITTPAQARRVAKHLRAGGEGWYITHYEVLSLLGVKNEPLPVQNVPVHEAEGERVVLDSTEFCPACHASRHGGWQQDSPLVCSAVHTEEVRGEVRSRTCGYVHKSLRVKSAAHHLAGAFRDGVICIDEGTLIKGDDSQRSKAIRGLQARNKLLATGTPISNYVNQIFWLMWWCLGDSSLRFPYSYDGGLAAFEADFCVLEYTYGREGSETAHRREKRKVLPQITNVSRFWRLSAPQR